MSEEILIRDLATEYLTAKQSEQDKMEFQ